MRSLNAIIESAYPPSTNDLWIDRGLVKYFRNGQWVTVGNNSVNWGDITGVPEFSEVATSGSYNDLTDKPAIPPAYTLPNASLSERGGVLMAGSVADLEGTEDTAAICTKINNLLGALRASGVLNL